MKNNVNKIFYVYAYLDPRKPGKYIYGEYEFDHEPFYIGKGKGKRLYRHLDGKGQSKDPNKYKVNKIQKILKDFGKNPIIIKLEQNLFDKDAINIEKMYIKAIGRADINIGPLTNLTNGGDGMSGKICSKETKEKLSKSHLGKQMLNETKEKISKSNKGKIRSHETRKKIGDTKIGNKNPNYGKIYSLERRIIGLDAKLARLLGKVEREEKQELAFLKKKRKR